MVTIAEKELEERAWNCGRFLVDFVNKTHPGEAQRDLFNRVRDSFGFRIPGPRNKLVREKWHPEIEARQTILRKLLLEIQKGKKLNQIEEFDYCCEIYREDRGVRLDVHDDNSITEAPLFLFAGSRVDYEFGRLDRVLAYCVVTCFKSQKCKLRIGKCRYESCGKYFFSERVGKRKFCPSEEGGRESRCKNAYHNERREPGSNKRFKSERKLDPDAPASYFGPDPMKR